VISCILQTLLSHNKTFSFRSTVTVVYVFVSLGNRNSTFRDNLVVSYSGVEILKIISIHGDVCKFIPNFDNQLTSKKASQLRMIPNAAVHIQDGFESVLKQVRCRGI